MARIISFLLLLFMWLPAAKASGPEEVEGLKAAFEEEVGRAVPNDAYREMAEREILRFAADSADFSRPQYAVFVDRNPVSQVGSVAYVDLASKRVVIIGVFSVSTGNPHRRGFFETPVGVFKNSPENMNYRALGTKNSKGWRGQDRFCCASAIRRNSQASILSSATPVPRREALNAGRKILGHLGALFVSDFFQPETSVEADGRVVDILRAVLLNNEIILYIITPTICVFPQVGECVSKKWKRKNTTTMAKFSSSDSAASVRELCPLS